MFADQLLGRIVVVDEEPGPLVNVVQHLQLLIVLVAKIAQITPDHRVVFLLDKTIVVFSVGSRTGKGNIMSVAVPAEVIVDEFTPFI